MMVSSSRCSAAASSIILVGALILSAFTLRRGLHSTETYSNPRTRAQPSHQRLSRGGICAGRISRFFAIDETGEKRGPWEKMNPPELNHR